MNFSKEFVERLENFQDLQLANVAIRAGNEEKLKEDEDELAKLRKEVVDLAKSGKTSDIIKMKHKIDDLQFEIDTLMAAIRTAPDISAEYSAADLRELWDDVLEDVSPEFDAKRKKLDELKSEAAAVFIDMAHDYEKLRNFRLRVKELMPDYFIFGYSKDYGLSPLPELKSFSREFSSDTMIGADGKYIVDLMNAAHFG